MKKILLASVILLGFTMYAQYPTPVKLKTITMADSYKGSSVRAYKVVSGYTKEQTNYLPANMQPNYHEPKKAVSQTTYPQDHYRGDWKTYDLDRQEGDSVAQANYYRTSDVAIYHGDRHPVYVSKNGKLFIWVVSANGNSYKKYIN